MTSTPTASGGRDFGLDVVRALAITCVLVTHSSLFLTPGRVIADGVFPALGLVGVELFFGLSGYLIGSMLMAGRHSVWAFYFRRMFKILPPYLVILVLLVIFAPTADRAFALFAHVAFIQDFFISQVAFFPVSWSLAIEFWFYLIAPLVILWRWERAKDGGQLLLRCLAVAAALVIARAIYVYTTHPLWEFGIHRFIPLRFDALMLGVAAAVVERQHTRLHGFLTRRDVAAINLVVLIALCAFFGSLYFNLIQLEGAYFFKATGLSAVGASVALLVLAAKRHISWPHRLPLVGSAVATISKISYSLYLTHLFVYFYFSALPGNKVMLLVFAVVTSLALAWLSYELFELRIVVRSRNAIERRYRLRREKSLSGQKIPSKNYGG